MTVGIMKAAGALQTQEKHLQTISQNLANVGTAGHKRGSTASHLFQIPGPHGQLEGQKVAEQIDFTQGNLKRTGRDLDFALMGDGFFAVDGPEGELYTRDGTFMTNSDGVLLTAEGLPVAWQSFSKAIDPTAEPVEVNMDGTVRQGGDEVGVLRIVAFEDNLQLERSTGGYLSAPEGLQEATADAEVHQRALEESNANGVNEMIAMITVQRHFETVAGVISTLEDSYRRLTRPF